MSIDRPNESSINYRRRWWATTIAIVILTTTTLSFKCKHCEFALSSKGVKCITTITWLNERNSITWWEELGVGMKATNCWAYQIEQIASHTHREWWKEPKEIESKWRLAPHDDDWIIERKKYRRTQTHLYQLRWWPEENLFLNLFHIHHNNPSRSRQGTLDRWTNT